MEGVQALCDSHMLSSIRRKTVMILTLAFSLVVARITTAFDEGLRDRLGETY